MTENFTLTETRALSLNRVANKAGGTFVLSVRGEMTPTLAEAFECREQLYVHGDTPAPKLAELKLEHKITSCEVVVPGYKLPNPTLVAGFVITPSKLAGADGRLDVAFRLKFSEGGIKLNKLMDKYINGDPFEMGVMSLQGNLFVQSESSATVVDADFVEDEEEQEEAAPLVQMTMEGDKAGVEEVISSGTLPTARSMGAAKRRRPATRGIHQAQR